jgi:hypothetical protein
VHESCDPAPFLCQEKHTSRVLQSKIIVEGSENAERVLTDFGSSRQSLPPAIEHESVGAPF